MPFKPYYIACLCLLSVFMLRAQTEDDLIVEQLMESLSEDLGEDFDYAELTERLHDFRAHPIDLNKTSGDDLLELRFLSPAQVTAILQRRKIAGDFVSVYELQTVEGLDLNTIHLLIPFVTVSTPSSLAGKNAKQLLQKGRQELMLRYGRVLEQQMGYTIRDPDRSRYLGTPDRLLLRYRYQYGQDLQVALSMKKDAGEPFFGPLQPYGFDFYSANITLANQGYWKKIVLGDYTLQFGTGLCLWTGLNFGKGALVQNIAREGLGLRPSASGNEFSFFRGIAASYERKFFTVIPFFSYKRLTATSLDDSLHQFSSISQSGLHRTPSELANKGQLGEWFYGANVSYRKEAFRIGLTAYQSHFDGELLPRPMLYNSFYFHGRSLTNISAYYHYSLKNVYLFGEAAHNLHGGNAFLNGLVAPLSAQWSIALLYRNYQRNYTAFYSQAFAEGSQTANENGFYTGLIFQPNQQLQWTAYVDSFHFPWLKYRVDAPSSGYDLFTQWTYTPDKQLMVNVRYRYRKKEENGETNAVNRVVPFARHQARLSVQYGLNAILTLRSRLEYAHYQKVERGESGYLFYQDVIVKPANRRWSGNLRLAHFQTDGYDSRIYAFENDVLYAYSSPFYSDKGWRYYLNLRYKMTRGIDIWCRYAVFLYTDKEEIGSALDRLEGNHKSEIKLQLRLQF